MLRIFFGNLIFAINDRMLSGNHRKLSELPQRQTQTSPAGRFLETSQTVAKCYTGLFLLFRKKKPGPCPSYGTVLNGPRRTVNLPKTWELLLRGKTTSAPPDALQIIGGKNKLKLMGVTFEQVPLNCDTHIDQLLIIIASKASKGSYIFKRSCKYYGYSIQNLNFFKV